TVWGQEFHEQAAPKDLKDVKSVSAGHGIFLALKRDGTVVAWENAANFTSTDAAMDIASIAASSGKGYVLKRDGQVLGRHHGGNVPGRPQDLPRIVKIASGPGSGCLMLARSGQVFQWGGHMLGGPIPKARQIRAGGGLYAIQKAGREWMIWGADPRGIELNREVVKMGPLKDLAFSSGVHTHRGYFIGIR
ncbi:MAG: hypothetical protein OER86_08800, partial [Phycisphaerae bacterium]|nr:hypothetical protein [Phycisphaerae bacterium]